MRTISLQPTLVGVASTFQLPTILLILSKGIFDRKLSCKSLL
jgi:hypothetical protein